MSQPKRAKMEVRRATATAPVNMAVIKYWGKRDEQLVIPTNDSLSVTLDQDQLRARTSVAASPDFTETSLVLNNKPAEITKRIKAVLEEARRRAVAKDPSSEVPKWHVRIVSENNFPTAAGLASSAAGLACLAAAIAQLYNIEDTELSSIARLGSGSACRSMYGGYVRWSAGVSSDGQDSVASQVAPASHWPDLEALILVVNAGKKATSSTSGMQLTVKTSPLLQKRIELVPQRMQTMEAAIQAKDFEAFAKLTMQDSNQFHATCLDTYPPIFYLNDISKAVIHVVTAYNAASGHIKAAYTFDAGPNAVIFCKREDVAKVMALIAHFFPTSKPDDEYYRGRTTSAPAALDSRIAESVPGDPHCDALHYIIHTGVGPGPQRITAEEQFLIDEDGNARQA